MIKPAGPGLALLPRRRNGSSAFPDESFDADTCIVRPLIGNRCVFSVRCQRAIETENKIYLPTSRPIQLGIRIRRDAETLAHISATRDTLPQIAAAVYQKSDPQIAKAAERNVPANLEKLQSDAQVAHSDNPWRAKCYIMFIMRISIGSWIHVIIRPLPPPCGRIPGGTGAHLRCRLPFHRGVRSLAKHRTRH